MAKLVQQLRGSMSKLGRAKKREVIMNTTDQDFEDWQPPVVRKSAEHRSAILAALESHFLFASFDRADLDEIVSAMTPTHAATGDTVIRQGDVGEIFYCLVSGQAEALIEGKGRVTLYDGVGAFGELSLMYSAPRAATVRAVSPCELFTLDLRSFQMLTMKQATTGLLSRVEFLKKVKLLEPLQDNDISRLAGAVTEESFPAGTHIITQGEEGDKFYIVKDGLVKCTNTGASGAEVFLIHIGPGDYFGEMALMLNAPRQANCIAEEDTSCFVCSREDFMLLLGPLQTLLPKLMRMRILRSVPVLRLLSDSELERVAKVMRVQCFHDGAKIIKEGKAGTRFYIINSGECEVSKKQEGGDAEVLSTLGQREFFGETSLLSKEPRSATVTAKGTVECLVLDQEVFHRLLVPSARGTLQDEMDRRQGKAAGQAGGGQRPRMSVPAPEPQTVSQAAHRSQTSTSRSRI